jgi:hypothetical protein
MPSTRSLQLFGEPRHLMHRVLRAFLVAPRMSQKSSQDPLIRQLFLKKAETQFQVHQGKSEEDWERTLFVLASASVLNESASLQQVDIERHFILMHFNSKLCMIFSLACVTTLVGFSWSFLSKIVTSMSWSGIGARYLALLALFFYVIARASGTKASQNHEHWRNLIVRSFVYRPPPRPCFEVTTPSPSFGFCEALGKSAQSHVVAFPVTLRRSNSRGYRGDSRRTCELY